MTDITGRIQNHARVYHLRNQCGHAGCVWGRGLRADYSPLHGDGRLVKHFAYWSAQVGTWDGTFKVNGFHSGGMGYPHPEPGTYQLARHIRQSA